MYTALIKKLLTFGSNSAPIEYYRICEKVISFIILTIQVFTLKYHFFTYAKTVLPELLNLSRQISLLLALFLDR